MTRLDYHLNWKLYVGALEYLGRRIRKEGFWFCRRDPYLRWRKPCVTVHLRVDPTPSHCIRYALPKAHVEPFQATDRWQDVTGECEFRDMFKNERHALAALAHHDPKADCNPIWLNMNGAAMREDYRLRKVRCMRADMEGKLTMSEQWAFLVERKVS